MLSKPPSKFSHTLQKFRICKFILIPMSHCHKNIIIYFVFVLKKIYILSFRSSPVSVCPVRTVRWRVVHMGIKSPNSHIGSYGYQKSKIITSSKTSKSKSVFEVKPNPYFEYFRSYFHGESKIKMCKLYQIFLIKKKLTLWIYRHINCFS